MQMGLYDTHTHTPTNPSECMHGAASVKGPGRLVEVGVAAEPRPPRSAKEGQV